MKNEDKEVSAISALLDFYSDRAVAHASFFVACIFGLFTVLSIIMNTQLTIHQIGILIVTYFALWIVGAYCLMGFGYFATFAEEIKNKICKYGPTINEKNVEESIYFKIVEDTRKKRLVGGIIKRFFEFKYGDVKGRTMPWLKNNWLIIIFASYCVVILVLPFVIILSKNFLPLL